MLLTQALVLGLLERAAKVWDLVTLLVDDDGVSIEG